MSKEATAGERLLSVEEVGHTYLKNDPEQGAALGEVTFDVRHGEVICIVGPSGCGKSTLLQILSGLLTPTTGAVRLSGERIDGVPDKLAMVFQDYGRSLFPWLRVRDNVEFPLQKHSKKDRARFAAAALQSVGLEPHADEYPWELSGGMQQRVAIARALAVHPRILLMDEPFASVDAQTRSELQDLILSIHGETEITMVVVTHDIDESIYLGDRVVALSGQPSSVAEIIDVELARPRHQLATRADPAFLEHRHRVFELLGHR